MSSMPKLRRVAMLSVHTSPLEQPGTGDAGGLNVYVAEVSKELARRGIEVEIFTRMTAGDMPLQTELAPGVHVRNVIAGPFEGLAKGRPAGPAVCLCPGRHARRGGPARGLVRPGPLPLLALRTGRLACGRSLARAVGAHHAHDGARQERPARRGRYARAARSRDRRDPGRRGCGPSCGQHDGRGW